MDVLQQEALLRNRQAILADLDVEYVEDYLLSRLVLNVDDIDRLHNKFLTRKERACYLLNILPTRGQSAFFEFIESLREPYSWLAESLEKDIKKPVSTGAEATQINSFEAQNYEDNIDRIPNEICETVNAVSSILSSLGTTICSLGDCLIDLANVINSLNATQKSTSIIATNFVNGSIRERKTGNVMRCTGGGDFVAQDKVNKTPAHGVEETEIALNKLSVIERFQDELKSDGVLDNTEYVRQRIDKVRGIKENVNSEVSNPSNLLPGRLNSIASSDSDFSFKESYKKTEFPKVASKSFVSGLTSPSPETELPVNSPDSGMFSGELSSHSLKSLSEVNDVDETDGRKMFIPTLPDSSEVNMRNCRSSCSEKNELTEKDFATCCKELRYKEQILQHALKDYISSVRSVAAHITNRTSGKATVDKRILI